MGDQVGKLRITQVSQQQAEYEAKLAAFRAVRGERDPLAAELAHLRFKASALSKELAATNRQAQRVEASIADVDKRSAEAAQALLEGTPEEQGSEAREYLLERELAAEKSKAAGLQKQLAQAASAPKPQAQSPGTKMTYAQAAGAAKGKGSSAPTTRGPAPQGPKQGQRPAQQQGQRQGWKSMPAAQFPTRAEAASANARCPLPSWDKDNPKALLLTVTGLEGAAQSGNRFRRATRAELHFGTTLAKQPLGPNAIRLLVRRECWGTAIEACRRLGWTPHPGLEPWAPAPGEETSPEEARTRALEAWDPTRDSERQERRAFATWLHAHAPPTATPAPQPTPQPTLGDLPNWDKRVRKGNVEEPVLLEPDEETGELVRAAENHEELSSSDEEEQPQRKRGKARLQDPEEDSPTKGRSFLRSLLLPALS
ncbi:hypothetical protein H4R18_005735 [Coemansia javaensis]|uniref:Uncharacterized protein n=1 Tax=Coemansia javaensis TaxID=2761396 RepID=A0A9W8LEW4_9FUNG|nr:hypothetical protein H4R18_005735 [Coemansia javaensis]